MTKINLNLSKNNPFKYVKEQKKFELKESTKKIYRQGDILFKKIEALPTDLIAKPDNVVADGEQTGHSHVLDNGALYELINTENLYIKANGKTKITHNEHFPIKLESGNYEVIRQREFLGKGIGRTEPIVQRVID